MRVTLSKRKQQCVDFSQPTGNWKACVGDWSYDLALTPEFLNHLYKFFMCFVMPLHRIHLRKWWMSSGPSSESTIHSAPQAQECLILILEVCKTTMFRSVLQNSHCSGPLRVPVPPQPNLDSWLIPANKSKGLVRKKKKKKESIQGGEVNLYK